MSRYPCGGAQAKEAQQEAEGGNAEVASPHRQVPEVASLTPLALSLSHTHTLSHTLPLFLSHSGS